MPRQHLNFNRPVLLGIYGENSKFNIDYTTDRIVRWGLEGSIPLFGRMRIGDLFSGLVALDLPSVATKRDYTWRSSAVNNFFNLQLLPAILGRSASELRQLAATFPIIANSSDLQSSLISRHIRLDLGLARKLIWQANLIRNSRGFRERWKQHHTYRIYIRIT
ncbi:MAG: hypothetical protein SF097_08400 [Acidobacteriota bacterium]|nr:hypothetical protein [Acidobacteriota bacterium]